MRVATISISTSRSGPDGRVDLATPALAAYVELIGGTVVGADLVTDDRAIIRDRLTHWADGGSVDLILTSGGTGLAPSDVTPEATRDVIDREAPGIAEAMRLASRAHTKYWMMSRAVAGVRGRTLIINFPGNPTAIGEAGAPLVDTLAHAMALLIRPVEH